MCEVVGDRPANVVNYPESELVYLRHAVLERKQRERDAMPSV